MFSRTTRLISTKLSGNVLGGWGFRSVQMKGLAPFGPNKGQNTENFDKSSKKSSSHEPLAGMH